MDDVVFSILQTQKYSASLNLGGLSRMLSMKSGLCQVGYQLGTIYLLSLQQSCSSDLSTLAVSAEPGRHLCMWKCL